MVLEIAILNVKPGEEPSFEAAFAEAKKFIQASQGYLGHELRRCVESPSRYLLQVRWERLEDHTEGFRGSTDYRQWAALLHHYYEPFPEVEYYSEPLGLNGTD